MKSLKEAESRLSTFLVGEEDDQWTGVLLGNPANTFVRQLSRPIELSEGGKFQLQLKHLPECRLKDAEFICHTGPMVARLVFGSMVHEIVIDDGDEDDDAIHHHQSDDVRHRSMGSCYQLERPDHLEKLAPFPGGVYLISLKGPPWNEGSLPPTDNSPPLMDASTKQLLLNTFRQKLLNAPHPTAAASNASTTAHPAVLVGGVYCDSQNMHYRVLHLARQSETTHWQVVYECLYPNPLGAVWVRSLADFTAEIYDETKQKSLPRFTRVLSSSVVSQ